MEHKDIDFRNTTMKKLLELNDITKLVVNGFIFFPNTLVSELTGPELKCLFGEDNIEDIISRYKITGGLYLGPIKYDVRRRLDRYVRNGGCVMHINEANVWIFTYDSVVRIERENFNSSVKAIEKSEIV